VGESPTPPPIHNLHNSSPGKGLGVASYVIGILEYPDSAIVERRKPSRILGVPLYWIVLIKRLKNDLVH